MPVSFVQLKLKFANQLFKKITTPNGTTDYIDCITLALKK